MSRRRSGSRPRTTQQPQQTRPLAVQQLAADLARRLPWLARGHIGTLCDALTTLGLDATGWTAADIVEHLDADNAATGRYQPNPDSQRNPIGLFLLQAQRALADVDSPVDRRRAAAEARTARRAADAAAALSVGLDWSDGDQEDVLGLQP